VTANGVDEGHINIPAPQGAELHRPEQEDGKVQWKDSSPASISCTANVQPVYAEVSGTPEIIFPGGDADAWF